MIKKVLFILLQAGLLWLIYYTGVIISEQFSLFLPGNIVGLILLLGLLYTKILPLAWIETIGGFLVKHLGLLFIPFCVGIAALQGFTMQSLLFICAVILVSAMISIGAVGSTYQWLLGKDDAHDRRLP